MGREVRMVPPDWEHPKNECGQYIPLHNRTFKQAHAEWTEGKAQWERGYRRDWSKDGTVWKPKDAEDDCSYEEWGGEEPTDGDYMPDFGDRATHYCMYEDTSEGTPISPAFATPEELARWLADNGASAFAKDTATYDQWLATIKRGFAISAVMTFHGDGTGTMQSGVAALADTSPNCDKGSGDG